MKGFLAVAAACVPLLTLAVQCSDPGKEGPSKHVTVAITSGTVLGPSNYGLWKAGDAARDSCHWSVVKKGKFIAKGGRHDAVISGTAAKGGILTATNCGSFHK